MRCSVIALGVALSTSAWADPAPRDGYRKSTSLAYIGLGLGGAGVTSVAAGFGTGAAPLIIPGRVLSTLGAPMMAGGSLRAATMGHRMTGKAFSSTGGSLAWGLWAGALVFSTVESFVPLWPIGMVGNIFLAGSYAAAGAQLAHNNRIVNDARTEEYADDEAFSWTRPRVRMMVAPTPMPGGIGVGWVGMF